MNYEKDKKLHIPFDELKFIMPDSREKLFMDMLQEYKRRFPQYKLLYAYLNRDATINIDYLIIFEAIGATSGNSTIRFDIPFIYTERATPGYRYCKREEILDDFFADSDMFMVTLSESRFNEYLNSIDLSVRSEKPEYWKKAENAKELCTGLSELSLYYIRKDI